MTDALANAIGRLIMVGVRGAEPGDPALESDLDACVEARCRGVILFDRDLPSGGSRNIRSPEQVRRLTSHLRNRLGPDTLIAIDQEGGRVARMKPEAGFAPSITASAFARLSPPDRRREADRLAQSVADADIDINFAPCVDLASNPANPIIAALDRAFSADPNIVFTMAGEIVDAHHRAGVAPCLKHFPGHGSSTADSHLGVADITETFDADRELAPYRRLLSRDEATEGPIAVMTGHLAHRAIDDALPASLSHSHTTGLLRQEIGFGGVIVADSIDMAAVAERHSIEESAVLALRAGADVILDCNNAPGPSRPCPALRIRAAIAEAVRADRTGVTERRIHESADRIRQLAEWTRRNRA
ncbi:MAG: glycoside hydrolase family 3 N-terminal domain-containing protein [Planctomycetota bacterium]|nr:glycoside hydrolase family 3 N-terminal domain-containing protein [Planctomycetota bacterium]